MTASRDGRGEMRNLLLDRDTADRLLSGSVAADDAPPGYAGVAELLRACARPLPSDAAHERTMIAAMSERIRARRSAHPSAFGRVAVRRPSRPKLVAVAVGAMLVGTSGLAFAGGLPAPAQRFAHTVFGSIGVDIPTAEAPAIPRDVSDGPEQPARIVDAPATTGGAISDLTRNHAGRAGTHGAIVSSEASDGHGHAGEPHGHAGEPHGQSDQPHGHSDEPHGQSDQPHGQSDQPHGQSDQPHGHSDEPHGHSDDPHGHSDDPHGHSDDPHGHSDEPHGRSGATHPA